MIIYRDIFIFFLVILWYSLWSEVGIVSIKMRFSDVNNIKIWVWFNFACYKLG